MSNDLIRMIHINAVNVKDIKLYQCSVCPCPLVLCSAIADVTIEVRTSGYSVGGMQLTSHLQAVKGGAMSL